MKLFSFNQISIKIAGPAGSGVKSTGHLLQRLLNRLGFYTLGYLGYPSLIRGGQNSYQIDFGLQPIKAPKSTTDIFLPLNQGALNKYANTLSPKAVIILDTLSAPDNLINQLNQHRFIKLPIRSTLTDNHLPSIVQNSLLVSIICQLFNYPNKPLKELITENFAKKGKTVIDDNLKAIKLGLDLAKKIKDNPLTYLSTPTVNPKKSKNQDNLVITGNQALVLGFIKAGGQFYSAYPMTPSSSILHFLAQYGSRHNILVRQASNEIEAVGAVIGASYAGIRAMTATSGGGFDLMTEFISMAATAEIPLVVVNAQRTGSGTGLPTWTEQADLNLAKYGGHGEFPRVVMAPGSPLEAYSLIQEAHNLADNYQLPVIFLMDKYLSESFFNLTASQIEAVRVKVNRGQLITQDLSDSNYLRYQLTKDGISPRTIPGVKNGLHIANSDDHDQFGNSIESDIMRHKMQTKRLTKLEVLRQTLPLPTVSGSPKAKIALVGWGSTKGVLEAVSQKLDIPTALVHFSYLYPLDHDRLIDIFKPFNQVILVENNSTGQLKEDLLLAGANLSEVILKFNGEPFFVDELLEKIRGVIKP